MGWTYSKLVPQPAPQSEAWGIRTCCGGLASRVSASDGALSPESPSEVPPRVAATCRQYCELDNLVADCRT
jgi:hypothetical protein